MITHLCQQCRCIWNDHTYDTQCPNCFTKTDYPPCSTEESIRFRLVESQGSWLLECKENSLRNKRYDSISWSEKPTKEQLNKTLSSFINEWLEE